MLLQIAALTILGRWWGSDLLKFPLRKFLIAFLAGAVFLPHWQLSIVIAVGFMIGNLLRDSIFDLLTKNDLKAALRMTFRGCSFLPLTLGVYLMHGLAFTPVVLLALTPALARAPIQYLCRFIPLPIQAEKKGFNQFWKGKAEMYEILWNAYIAAVVVIGIALGVVRYAPFF